MAGQSISVGLNPETGKYLAVDDFTDALVVLQGDHYYIHEGQAFQYPAYITIEDEENYEFGITTAAASEMRYVHWRPTRISSVSSGVKVELFESPTFTGGTAATLINMNRNSSRTASTSLVYEPTVTDDGTLISVDALGKTGTPARVGAGTGGNENEIVFKPATKYLLRITNLTSTDTDVSSNLYWYEEDDG